MAAPDEPDTAPDLTAAELALGVLDGQERGRALRRILSDPTFAREVADWRARLEGLLGDLPEVEPGPEVERRVLASAGVSAPAATRHPSLTAWRAATGVSAATAAVLLGLLMLRPPEVVRMPAEPRVASVAPAPLVAVIAPEKGAPFSAIYDRSAGEVRLAGTVTVPRGRDAELWAISADGVPRAIGLLTTRSDLRLKVGDPVVMPGTTLAISIEPVGGSPNSTPTGPVVATGKLIIV